MSNSTASRLTRELGRSPKKAVLLGLLLLVAMYFWLPLVYGWVKGTSVPLDAVLPVATIMPPPSGLPAAPKAASAALSWQHVVKAMESDPRMASAATLPADRDPFENIRRKVVDAAAPVAKVQALVTPDTAGLVLSSTVVGPRSRSAFVNGKTYHVGDIIHVTADGEPVTFAVVEIDTKQIVLEREKRRYVMKIKLGLKGDDFLGAAAAPAAEAAARVIPAATQ